MTRARWPWVLAAMVVLTGAATTLYLLAPFESPERVEVDRGLPGMAEPPRRIVAVREDGSLVVLDEESGALSEVVVEEFEGGGIPRSLALGGKQESAFVERRGRGGEPTISIVILKTGKTEALTAGRAPAVGRMHHEALPRVRKGPEVELLAWAAPGNPEATIEVENRTTGATRVFGVDEPGHAPVTAIETLDWDPFSEAVYFTGPGPDGSVALWRLDTERGRSLADAELVGPEPGSGAEWVEVASLLERLVVIERRAGEPGARLVTVDRRTGRRLGPLLDTPLGNVVVVDADASHRRLLAVTDGGHLYRWNATTAEPPTLLVEGIVDAAW